MNGLNLTGILLFVAFMAAPGRDALAQLLNYDKMNRSELREQVAIQLGKVDSLYREVVKANIELKKAREENARLIRALNATETDMDGLMRDIKMMRSQVTGLEATVREKQTALNDVRGTADSLVSAIGDQDRTHKKQFERLQSAHQATLDSLTVLLETIKAAGSRKSTMVPGDDFLTNFLRTPYPLTNNLFSFSLQKVILGDKQFEGSDYYNGENNRSPLTGLPEIIDLADLTAERPTALALTREMEPHEFMKEAKLPQVMTEFPSMEITRNKLVTLRYPDGREESLMFNFVRETENNGRIAGHLTMVAERKDLSEEENELDIKWPLYALGNQVFLALTRKQIERIGVYIREFDKRFFIVDKEQREVDVSSLSDLSL
ncbi:MAG: hypothetical protein ACKO3B_05350, partial [Bacteroidota bacterium]